MTAGGRLPAASVVLNTWTACSALPASRSLAALSTARWDSSGSDFFLAAACATVAPASAGSRAGLAPSPAALPAARAPVPRTQANAQTAATGTLARKRQARAILPFPVPRFPYAKHLLAQAYVKSKARG